MSNDAFFGPPTRHRADDDVEALAAGTFAAVARTPNGDVDLLKDNSESDDPNNQTPSSFAEDKKKAKDESDKPRKEKSTVRKMKQRTNEIVSEYRDYLTEMDRLGDELCGYDAGDERADDGEAVLIIPAGGGGVLHRTWSRQDDANVKIEAIEVSDTPEWPEYPGLTGSFTHRYGDKGKSYSYKSPLFQEKKFRLQLLCLLAVIALFGVLIVFTAGGHSHKSKDGTDVAESLVPAGSPEEPAEPKSVSSDIFNRPPSLELDIEEDVASEDITENQPSQPDQEPESEQEAEPQPEAPVVASQPSDHLVYADQSKITEHYKPLWFTRDTGWNGTTFEAGVNFCKDQAEGRNPCPYDAYCPDGPGRAPLLGTRGGQNEEQWSPMTMTSQPGMQIWVSVGSESTCLHNVDLDVPHPLTNNMTQYIMCCSNPSSAQVSSPSDSANEDTPESAAAGEDSSNSPAADEGADSSTTPADDASGDATNASADDSAETSKQAIVVDGIKYNPMWLSRENGWFGRTYREAEMYCRGIVPNGQLCSYDILCPDGVGQQPYPLDRPEMTTEQWAPVKNPQNTWILVNPGGLNPADICQNYVTLNNVKAAFGLNGEQLEKKENILCCSVESDESP